MTFHRYVALGDSFTEGVGDPDPARPNGLRGWADRVAEVLATRTDDFGYANLAIRGRTLPAILDEQLEPALALAARPGHDLRRRQRHPAARASTSTRSSRRTTTPSAGSPPPAPGCACSPRSTRAAGDLRPMRGRFALYNERVREIADRHGAAVVDSWRMRDVPDFADWDTDRLHLGAAGHQRMAIEVLDTLGVAHGLAPLDRRRRARSSAGAAGARARSPGRASSARRGSTAGSPGAPPATRSRPRHPDPGDRRRADPRRPAASGTISGRIRHADVAQLVERDLPKVDVASSSLVIRSSSHAGPSGIAAGSRRRSPCARTSSHTRVVVTDPARPSHSRGGTNGSVADPDRPSYARGE